MIHSMPDVAAIIVKLAHIEAAGLLPDVEHEIADQLRGPRDPLEKYPRHKFSVEYFARACSRMTGLPYATCKKGAVEAILPSTRLQVAISVIDDFYARVQEQPARAFSRAILSRSERRISV